MTLSAQWTVLTLDQIFGLQALDDGTFLQTPPRAVVDRLKELRKENPSFVYSARIVPVDQGGRRLDIRHTAPSDVPVTEHTKQPLFKKLVSACCLAEIDTSKSYSTCTSCFMSCTLKE